MEHYIDTMTKRGIVQSLIGLALSIAVVALPLGIYWITKTKKQVWEALQRRNARRGLTTEKSMFGAAWNAHQVKAWIALTIGVVAALALVALLITLQNLHL